MQISAAYQSDLEVNNLSFERDDALVFDSLSFKLKSGEILILQGANGAGKTTLLKCLGRTLTPSAGDILWHGRSLLSEDAEVEAEYSIAKYSLGHKNALKSLLSPYENCALSLPLAAARTPSSDEIRAVLNDMAISTLAEKPCCYLSQGQNRRVALAMLILARKALWLLDEPTAALDTEGQDILIRQLSLHLERGGSAIVSTHQPLTLFSMPQKVLSLNKNNEDLCRQR